LGKFREHGVMLFLDHELYLGFIKLQADRGLGRSFAGLLPFNEGLFQMGYINKETYEKHKAKYSVKLGVAPSLPVETKYAKQIESFENILKQWPDMRDEPRKFWIEKAEKWKDKLPIAEQLLAKAKEPMLSNQDRVEMKKDEEFLLKAKPVLTQLSYNHPDDKQLLDSITGKCKKWVQHSPLAKCKKWVQHSPLAKEILEVIGKQELTVHD